MKVVSYEREQASRRADSARGGLFLRLSQYSLVRAWISELRVFLPNIGHLASQAASED
jgi:hypothetical protein